MTPTTDADPRLSSISRFPGSPMSENVRPPWLPEIQRPPRSVPPTATRPGPLLFDADHRAISTVDGWDREATRTGGPLAHVPRHDSQAARRPPVPKVLRRRHGAGSPSASSSATRPSSACRWKPISCGRRRRGPRRPGVVVLHSTVDYTIRQPAGLEGPPTCTSAFTWPAAATWRFARVASSGNTAGRAASARPSTGSRNRHPGIRGHGQDALRRDPRRRSAGKSARRRSHPARRDRPLPGWQGGPLPVGLRPPDPVRRFPAREASV